MTLNASLFGDSPTPSAGGTGLLGNGLLGSTSGVTSSGTLLGNSSLTPVGTSYGYGINVTGNGLLGYGQIGSPVQVPVQTGPQGVNVLITDAVEDTTYTTFNSADFAISDGTIATNLQIVTLPTNGVLQLSSASISAGQYLSASQLASLSYVPDSDFSGNDSFSVAMSIDGTTFDSTPSSVTLSVANTQDPPVITVQPEVTIQDDSTDSTSIGASILASFSDTDGDSLDSVTVTAPAAAAGTMTYSNSAGAVFTIAPTATASLTPAELATLSLAVPDLATSATTAVAYTVTDSGGGTTSGGSLTLNLAEGNDAPTFTASGPFSIPENDNVTTVTPTAATDPDGDTLVYSITGADAAAFTVDTATGALNFTAAQDFEAPSDADADGTYDLTIVATDPSGLTASTAIEVDLTDVASDQVPTMTSASAFTVAEPTTAVATLSAMDLDLAPTGTGDSLTYTIVGGADSSSFALTAAGALSFTAAPDLEAPSDADADNVYEVEFEVEDLFGNIDSQAVAVTVTGIDDTPPVFDATSAGSAATTANTASGALTATISENAAIGDVVLDLDFTDGEFGSAVDSGVTYAITPGTLFDIDINTGEISVKAALDYDTGPTSHTVTVTVTDDAVNAANSPAPSTSVTINLLDENDAPTITATTVTVNEDAFFDFVDSATLAGFLGFTDTNADDVDPASWAVVTGPDFGTFDLANFTYTPDPDHSGSAADTVTLTVDDDNADPLTSGTATITFDITEIGDAPSLYGNGATAGSAAGAATITVPRGATPAFDISTLTALDIDDAETFSFAVGTVTAWSGGSTASGVGLVPPAASHFAVTTPGATDTGILSYVGAIDIQDAVVEVVVTDSMGLDASWYLNIDFV